MPMTYMQPPQFPNQNSGAPISSSLRDNSKDPERSLVIGYVSTDYFTHYVLYFSEAPLFYHDYVNYKVVIYLALLKEDGQTFKFRDIVLKRGAVWRDIYGIDEKKVASMVREDKVDILVELTGHAALHPFSCGYVIC